MLQTNCGPQRSLTPSLYFCVTLSSFTGAYTVAECMSVAMRHCISQLAQAARHHLFVEKFAENAKVAKLSVINRLK